MNQEMLRIAQEAFQDELQKSAGFLSSIAKKFSPKEDLLKRLQVNRQPGIDAANKYLAKRNKDLESVFNKKDLERQYQLLRYLGMKS